MSLPSPFLIELARLRIIGRPRWDASEYTGVLRTPNVKEQGGADPGSCPLARCGYRQIEVAIAFASNRANGPIFRLSTCSLTSALARLTRLAASVISWAPRHALIGPAPAPSPNPSSSRLDYSWLCVCARVCVCMCACAQSRELAALSA
jgi:hypothetical protein